MTGYPVHASAPGKLFLFGEYAVLHGAPAIISAVNRRVAVRLEPAPDGHWRLSSAQLGMQEQRLEPGKPAPDSRLDIVLALLEEFERASLLPPASSLYIDSSAFYDHDGKLGLGSSAAVTAALLCALLEAAGKSLDTASRYELARRAHTRAQGGQGSGGDIAASLYGGVLHFEAGQLVKPLPELADMEIICVRAGEPASTRDFLARYQRSRATVPDPFESIEGTMQTLSSAATTAWSSENVTEVIRLAGEYGRAMAELGRACDLPIAGDSFAALDRAARILGGCYKPSGAGGGDVGLLFLPAGIPGSTVERELSRAGAGRLRLQTGDSPAVAER